MPPDRDQGVAVVNRVIVGIAACLLLACGEAQDEAVQSEETLPDSAAQAAEPEPVPFDSIPMPAYPEARRGRLVAVSAGTIELSGSWAGQAGICDEAGFMQILAEIPGRGTLILLQMPADDRLVAYPIKIVDSGLPPAPAAQVGVQILEEGGTYGFQAAEGEVYLDSISNGEVSGRIATTLREITSDERVRYAGVFSRIPLTPHPPEYCDQLTAALSPPDSTGAEGQ